MSRGQRAAGKAIGDAILTLAGAGLSFALRHVAPELSQTIASSLPDFGPVSHGSVQKALRRLEQRGYLRRHSSEEAVYLELTQKGRDRVDQRTIADLVLPERPAVWDGKWRLVLFDVAEDRRVLRHVFRCKLQNLGFVYAQRSAWLYPFACEREIGKLARRLGIQDDVVIVVAEPFDSDAKFRRRFGLVST